MTRSNLKIIDRRRIPLNFVSGINNMRPRRRSTLSVIACFAFAVCLVETMHGFAQSENPLANSVAVRSKPNKSKLLLGEPLTVGFEIENVSNAPVKVGLGGVDSGGLKIYIAHGNGAFNEYFGRGWGRRRGGAATLDPGKSVSLGSPTILWNGKPNVSHLNEDAARQVLAGKIVTEYAFQEPGIYFLKGRTYIGPEGSIESEPARIEILEPTGEDLEVWKQIKGNHDIAILMQNAEVDVEDIYAKRQLIETVERIIANHSTSVYAEYLRTKLEEFKVREARRNAYFKR